MRASTLAVSTRPPRNFNKTGPGDEATAGPCAGFWKGGLIRLTAKYERGILYPIVDGVIIVSFKSLIELHGEVGVGYPTY